MAEPTQPQPNRSPSGFRTATAVPKDWRQPSPEVMAQTEAVFGEQPYRVLWDVLNYASQYGPGAIPVSWWRDPRTNRAVGGKSLSQHVLTGTAVDLYAANLQELAAHLNASLKAAGERAFVYVEPRIGKQGPHVHVSTIGEPGVGVTAQQRVLLERLRQNLINAGLY